MSLNVINEGISSYSSLASNLTTEEILTEVNSNVENIAIEATAQTPKLEAIAQSTSSANIHLSKVANSTRLLNSQLVHNKLSDGKEVIIDYSNDEGPVRKQTLTYNNDGELIGNNYKYPPYGDAI